MNFDTLYFRRFFVIFFVTINDLIIWKQIRKFHNGW